ncbi:hypothetical protein DFJ77DRAFT_202312 [Powellomyces hirtus]|nr:hypothetical protein DFJ77DRAFT_202312 [Powellomyces hirtus]
MDSEPRLAGRISKQINVFVQFAHFNNIDMFQKGLYQLQCRLYAAPRDPSRRRRRVDALPIETLPGEGHSASTPLPTFLSETSKELRYNCFPTHFAKRTSCPVHPLKKCSWRCRTDGPSNLHNVWVSKSFYISRVNEQVTLHHGAVFSFDLDAIVSDGGDATSISDEGGKTSDAYLEVELWFTADEGMTNPEDFEYQQGRRFRLSNLLSPSASTRLHQYAGVSYSGTFFSSCSFVVSTCVIGYRFSGQPPVRRSNSRLGSSDRLIYLSLPNLWKKISEWPRDLAQENDSTGPSDGRVPTADKLMETWTIALQIRNLFARALNVDWSVNDPWDAATSDLLDLEDRLRFLDTSDTLIKEFTMVSTMARAPFWMVSLTVCIRSTSQGVLRRSLRVR